MITITNEQKMEQIRSYIDDIKSIQNQGGLSVDEKQHLKKALDVYNSLYDDAEKGKMDPDIVYENITSFLYMLQ